MPRRFLRRIFPLVVGFSVLSGSASAQQTGTLSGVVRDAQGGVLPGVTVSVSSPVLIGGARTTTTGDTGTYQFTGLAPGPYEVRYELSGFTTLRRDDIRLQVAQTTRLDVELAVGNLQETVTVSGESPIVDVSSTTTQTNISKELYEAIPTGRNPWVMAGLVPGVVTGRLDVGGTEGMQHTTSKHLAPPTARSRSPSTASRRTGAAAAAERRCSTTASRCTRNTTCRRRRAPRKAT